MPTHSQNHPPTYTHPQPPREDKHKHRARTAQAWVGNALLLNSRSTDFNLVAEKGNSLIHVCEYV